MIQTGKMLEKTILKESRRSEEPYETVRVGLLADIFFIEVYKTELACTSKLCGFTAWVRNTESRNGPCRTGPIVLTCLSNHHTIGFARFEALREVC